MTSKPEPLKGKGIISIDQSTDNVLFQETDIRSAVEYLKNRVKYQGWDERVNKIKVFLLINQAFEDVMKNDRTD